MPVLNAAAERVARDNAVDPFALWAEVYDEQPNPLLSLEEDLLSSLLPDAEGLDVIDIGCGTGRWLQRFAAQHPRSLIGIDSSREMIARAAARVGDNAVLLRAECESAELPAGSADLCLASFVLSHLRSLQGFAREVARILRPGGCVFIADVHPETVAALGWKRAFRHRNQSIALQTYERPIQEVMTALLEHGFQVSALLEPCFQVHQQQALALHNSRFEASALGSPAIYTMQLCLPGAGPASTRKAHGPTLQLTGARVAIGPGTSTVAQLALGEGRINSISTRSLDSPHLSSSTSIDLSGYLLLPGLINSHDHLDFGLFPKLGRGDYRNSAEWAEDIQRREAAVIAHHRRIPKAVRCWWGAIRNLLCGATTVCHHNPPLGEFSDPDFPVRVLRDYEWAHSLSFDSVDATKLDVSKPFVIHAGEGVDENSAKEFSELDRRGLLNDRTVLVHALALDEAGLFLLNQRRAAVVWCPTSNRFLFGRTLDGNLLSQIDTVLLGSDSALTSPGDLLDDIRFAYRELGIHPERIYDMVFTAPARVFRTQHGEGGLKPGGVADLIAIRDTSADPAEALAHLSSHQIELIVLRGRVQLARSPIRERLPDELREGLEPLQVDEETVWLRAPIAQLFASAGGSFHTPLQVGGKRVQCVAND